MKVSEQGQTFIKSYEKCRLIAYDDGVGVWTIGWGHTKGVRRGDTCTQDQADAWFEQEITEFENQLNVLILPEVNQHQFDALVSLAYNIGVQAFSKSTLLRLLNEGSHAAVPEQFDRWNRGGGQVMQGLVKRRAAERKIYVAGVYEMHV